MSKHRGTVKWFNTKDGYGFITPDEGGDDIFVHISALKGIGERSLREGQKIEYDVVDAPKEGEVCAGNLVLLD